MPQKFLKIFFGVILLVLLLEPVSRGAEEIEDLVLKGSYREAISEYGSTKNLGPAENYLLGLCYRETGEIRKAENIWQTLLSGPEKERALLALAYLKSADNALTESEKLFRQFSNDFPNSQYQPAALLGLAEVLARKKKNEGTQGSLEVLARLRRNYPFSKEAGKASEILNRDLGPYTIQIGSFADSGRAEKVSRDLNSKGYDAYIVRSFDNGSFNYQVRVGNFPDRKKAESAGQELKRETGLDYFIKK